MTIPRRDAVAQERPESPELVPRNIAAGIRLGMATTVFVFLAPIFAYLYLRQLNNGGMWRPADVSPPQVYGWAILCTTLASAAALAWANGRAPKGRPWKPLAGASLVLGLAAVFLQCFEYAHLGFGPTSGGYASVFFAWTSLTGVLVLSTMIWLETLVAYVVRHPDAPPEVVLPRLSGLTWYWTFLAGLSVFMWLLLYPLGV